MGFPTFKAPAIGCLASGCVVVTLAVLALYVLAPGKRVIQQSATENMPWFEDVTRVTGVQHNYRNGEESNHHSILETPGGGSAVFDFDNDGRLDLFFTGGGQFGGSDNRQIIGLPSKLYRSLGDGKFEDVTRAVGLDQPLFYTHGAAAIDFDRDGWVDLLVTGFRRLVLYRNESDGQGGRRFRDVTRAAGLGHSTWTTSAAWGDLDGDGWPDLYICQYVDWSWENHPTCTYLQQTVDNCSPKKFNSLPHLLYRNNGDGTFTEVSKSAGLRVPRSDAEYGQLKHLDERAIRRLRAAADQRDYGKGLGVLMVDVNGDGKPDVYVANDTTDNLLYINRSRPGEILFAEEGLESGVARDGNGTPNGSMGLDAADIDGSGRPSLFVTNYEGELPGLYLNECERGVISFNYVTQQAGLVALGMNQVSWGTQFLDLDHRGWPGLFLSNGHVLRFPQGTAKRSQLPMLLRSDAVPTRPGWRKFVDRSEQGGPYFAAEHRGRGAAFGDLDNDGRTDIVLNHLNESAVVLRNIAPTEGRHWLGVELHGKDRRCVVGTKVTLEVDGRALTRFCRGGGSYLCSHDRRLTFGLGENAKVGRLTVHWAHGTTEHRDGLAVDRYWRVEEGK